MPVMKRTLAVLVISILGALSAFAQQASSARSNSPAVKFVLDWPAQNPSHFSIVIDSAGRATYRSEPSADANGGSAPDPYNVEWTVTDATRQRIFDAIPKLNFLHGNFESKSKVAMTGKKTLSYRDASHDNSITFNYSDNATVRDLTHLFQAIEATTESGRKLVYDLRYDKLGVDADLKGLQEQQRQGDAEEFGAIEPILQKIANDDDMLRMSQQRAKEILRTAGLNPAAPPATSAQQ
jgi:hypothetical protein